MPEVTTTSPTLMSDVPRTYSSRSDSSPVPMATPCARVRSTMAPTAALRSMSSCTLAARALGTMTRPTTPSGDNTAMSGRSPALVPLPSVTVRKSGVAEAAMTSAAVVSELDAATQVEQPRELGAALRKRALLLQPDLRVGELLAQALVFGAHAAQVHVPAPQRAHGIHGAGPAALQLGDQAEGHRLQHGHARLRRDLCRDQDDVRDDDEHEQDGTATPPMLEHGHRHQRVRYATEARRARSRTSRLAQRTVGRSDWRGRQALDSYAALRRHGLCS